MSFKENLKRAIEFRGITQREFAERVGLTEQSVCRYLNGSRDVKLKNAVKMANELNVSLDWLCGNRVREDIITSYQEGWNDAIDSMTKELEIWKVDVERRSDETD